MLAMVLSLIAISMTSGNVLGIFPVNTLFWLGVSATIIAVVGVQAEPKPEPVPTLARPLNAFAQR
jgi:hypothetical protein